MDPAVKWIFLIVFMVVLLIILGNVVLNMGNDQKGFLNGIIESGNSVEAEKSRASPVENNGVKPYSYGDRL